MFDPPARVTLAVGLPYLLVNRALFALFGGLFCFICKYPISYLKGLFREYLLRAVSRCIELFLAEAKIYKHNYFRVGKFPKAELCTDLHLYHEQLHEMCSPLHKGL